MVIDMNASKLDTIERIREFMAGTTSGAFPIPSDESWLRDFIVIVLERFRYYGLVKGRRRVLFTYMRRLTGYS